MWSLSEKKEKFQVELGRKRDVLGLALPIKQWSVLIGVFSAVASLNESGPL